MHVEFQTFTARLAQSSHLKMSPAPPVRPDSMTWRNFDQIPFNLDAYTHEYGHNLEWTLTYATYATYLCHICACYVCMCLYSRNINECEAKTRTHKLLIVVRGGVQLNNKGSGKPPTVLAGRNSVIFTLTVFEQCSRNYDGGRGGRRKKWSSSHEIIIDKSISGNANELAWCGQCVQVVWSWIF